MLLNVFTGMAVADVPAAQASVQKLTELSRCLVNLQPSGEHFMEDFYYAGGLPVVIRAMGDRLHSDCLTANGRTIAQNSEGAVSHNPDVITTPDRPFKSETGLAVVSGNGWDQALDDADWIDGEILALGTSPRGDIARVFLGSRGAKIMRHSPVPVLVLPG